MDVWTNFGISAILTALAEMKGPKKKAQLKRAMLKVYRAIKVAYSDDPDFN